jgi:hypothetical protein
MSIKDISEATAIRADDVVKTLESLSLIKVRGVSGVLLRRQGFSVQGFGGWRPGRRGALGRAHAWVAAPPRGALSPQALSAHPPHAALLPPTHHTTRHAHPPIHPALRSTGRATTSSASRRRSSRSTCARPLRRRTSTSTSRGCTGRPSTPRTARRRRASDGGLRSCRRPSGAGNAGDARRAAPTLLPEWDLPKQRTPASVLDSNARIDGLWRPLPPPGSPGGCRGAPLFSSHRRI